MQVQRRPPNLGAVRSGLLRHKYGTLQFPQERVYCLAGWNDRVFEIMRKLDRDSEALVRDVESVPLED